MYNVLIVDDDTLMRNALRAMISRFKNFQIIGEAANGAEAIAICRLYPLGWSYRILHFYGYHYAWHDRH